PRRAGRAGHRGTGPGGGRTARPAGRRRHATRPLTRRTTVVRVPTPRIGVFQEAWMTVTDDDALVGQTLDRRYVIHERIARGGMASVFRATDLRLDRIVAVKIMHPDTDLEDTAERFVREAQSAAKLNHCGIVSVYDQGVDGDTIYLVMEYVPGRTLRDVMRD